MKKTLLFLILILISSFSPAQEPLRTWTTQSGKEIEGTWEPDRESDSETVYFRTTDGKLRKIAFDKLSKADQQYVTSRRSARSAGEFEEVEEDSSKGIKIVPAGNRYALLIGVNAYQNPIRSLRFCVQDMALLSDTFVKIGFEPENITLMTDTSEGKYQPTGSNIRRQLQSLCEMMGPDDMLIVAFSGHGAMIDGKTYICPSDSDLKSADSLVSREWAYQQLDDSQAKQKLFFIDACRSEITLGGGKSLGDARVLTDQSGGGSHGFLLMASCDKGQQSWEMGEIKQGAFTYFIVQGLLGAASSEEGDVSVLGLADYVSRKTKQYVHRNMNEVQVPTFKQSGELSNFLLFSRPSQSASLTPSAPVLPSVPLSPTPGERLVKTVNGVEFAFRWCPAGTFTMGSPSSEPDREDDETQHQVTLTRGFWLLETEVTQAQWKVVMGDNPSIFKGDNLPVECVSWNDCQKFCSKLSSQGLKVTLPTEAQWEYACRAGTTGAYAGNLDDMAWYGDNSGSKTYEVGQKKPNAWGLYDMHGNVWEWCSDWYDEDYYSASPASDPTGPTSGTRRVDRGGSWYYDAQYCRSANRSGITPTNRYDNIGFRPVFLPQFP